MAKQNTATSTKDDDDYKPGETQQELAERQRKAAEAAGPPVTVKAVVPTLQSGRVKPAESEINPWSVTVDHGVTKSDLERTEFWVHHSRLFRPRDLVHVNCVDGSFYARLIVTAVGPKDVKMHVCEFINLDPVAPDAFEVPNGYSVNWGGSLAKFRVQRGHEVVREGFEQRSEAVAWLGSHLQSLAR